MATQKQRRRRAKEKRHAYDLVEIDGEGNETVLSATDLKSESPPKATAKKSDARASAKPKPARGTPKPPSWRRVLKRGALFAPIFLATVMLLAGDRLSFAGALVQTAVPARGVRSLQLLHGPTRLARRREAAPQGRRAR